MKVLPTPRLSANRKVRRVKVHHEHHPRGARELPRVGDEVCAVLAISFATTLIRIPARKMAAVLQVRNGRYGVKFVVQVSEGTHEVRR